MFHLQLLTIRPSLLTNETEYSKVWGWDGGVDLLSGHSINDLYVYAFIMGSDTVKSFLIIVVIF